MYEAAYDYLDSISADDRVLVLHHWDMDGSASAAIISKLLEHLRGREADFVKIPEGRKHQVGERAERLMRDEDITHLIVLDMNLPVERAQELEELDVALMNIDHHSFEAIPEHVVFVNPRVEDDAAYIPAAKLCNDIAEHFDLDTAWIAGLGVIQDFAVEGNEELFEQLKEQYPLYFPKELNQQSLAKHCRYGKYSSVMNIKPYRNSDRCAQLAHDALKNAKTLKYLEARQEYRELYGFYQAMYDEIERVIRNFDEISEMYDDEQLIFFQFDSEFHINSSIATRISLDREEWVHIIANTHSGEANVSARCQSGRVDLATLLRNALPSDVEGEAGGHRKAAGASMPAERLDEFKEAVLDQL